MYEIIHHVLLRPVFYKLAMELPPGLVDDFRTGAVVGQVVEGREVVMVLLGKPLVIHCVPIRALREGAI